MDLKERSAEYLEGFQTDLMGSRPDALLGISANSLVGGIEEQNGSVSKDC